MKNSNVAERKNFKLLFSAGIILAVDDSILYLPYCKNGDLDVIQALRDILWVLNCRQPLS